MSKKILDTKQIAAQIRKSDSPQEMLDLAQTLKALSTAALLRCDVIYHGERGHALAEDLHETMETHLTKAECSKESP